MKDTLSICKEKPELQELFANRQPGSTVRIVLDFKIDENLDDRVVGLPLNIELAPGEEPAEPDDEEEDDEEVEDDDNPMGPAVLAVMTGGSRKS